MIVAETKKAKQNKGTKGTRQLKETRGTQVCPEMQHVMLHFPRNLGTCNLGQKTMKTTCPSFHKTAHVQELKNKTPREHLPRTSSLKATGHENVAVQQKVPKRPDWRNSERGNWEAPWLKKMTILEEVQVVTSQQQHMKMSLSRRQFPSARMSNLGRRTLENDLAEEVD